MAPSNVSTDRVLLIDDEAIVCDVLSQVFRKKGLTVVTAGKVAEAIGLLETQKFGCLLVDKNLPDGSGLEVIRRARELQPLCACIVLTAYPNVESILQALRLGAVDYLEKPFPQMALVQEKVLQALARQRLAAEREALLQRVQELQAARPEMDFELAARAALAQQALDVAKEDHKRELDALTEALETRVQAAEARLEGLKQRHQRAIVALRRGAALAANLLDAHALPADSEQDVRELRRALTALLDEIS